MSPAPSSPEADDVVDLFVVGRTLRGSAGRAFVQRVLGLYDELHASGAAPFTDIGRTVELTVVAVTRVAPVSLEVSIADPAFGGASHRATAPTVPGASGLWVALDELDGVDPVAAPPHLDLSRSVVVTVDSDSPVELRMHVLEP